MNCQERSYATCKPVGKYFKHPNKVIVVDDELIKAYPEEEENFLILEPYNGENQYADAHIRLFKNLVDALRKVACGQDPYPDGDQVQSSKQGALSYSKDGPIDDDDHVTYEPCNQNTANPEEISLDAEDSSDSLQ